MLLNIIRLIAITLLLVQFQRVAHATETLFIDGSTGVKPLVESLAQHLEQTSSKIRIDIGSGLKPQDRINALLNDEIHIAMASHGINLQQIEAQGLAVHRIAKMAVVFGVNHSVTLTDISQSELCQIYRLEVVNWQLLGASNLAIKPFIRPYNEVDSEVVSAYIPCFSTVPDTAAIPVMEKSGQMANALGLTEGAIGMTTLVRVTQSLGKIRALSIDGIRPNTGNLISGAYTLTRSSYLITAADPSPKVAAFLTFVRSAEGAQIIIANNAIPAS